MLTFNRADAQTVAALQRLKSPEMQPLLMFLNNMQQDTLTAMIAADTEHFRRLQGRAGLLREILDTVENAGSILEKLR